MDRNGPCVVAFGQVRRFTLEAYDQGVMDGFKRGVGASKK